MRRRQLCLAAALALPGVAWADAAERREAVRRRMNDATLLRGEFVQTRRVEGFHGPLQSSGELVVVRGGGVLWTTRRPFVSTLVVTPDRLDTRDASGRLLRRTQLRDEPLLRSVNTLLLALVAADLEALATLFRLEAELLGDAGWRLRLKPIDSLLSRQLAQVEINGERFVQQVQIEERNGNDTHVAFAGWRSGGELTAAERALLAGS